MYKIKAYIYMSITHQWYFCRLVCIKDKTITHRYWCHDGVHDRIDPSLKALKERHGYHHPEIKSLKHKSFIFDKDEYVKAMKVLEANLS